jgi:hypothetical protein
MGGSIGPSVLVFCNVQGECFDENHASLSFVKTICVVSKFVITISQSSS